MNKELDYKGIEILANYPGQNDPHGQLDKSMCDILKTLIGKPKEEVEKGLLKVLNDSCFYSLASDFVMKILILEYKLWSGKDWRPQIVNEIIK